MCKFQARKTVNEKNSSEKKEIGGTAATMDMLLDSLPTKPEMFMDNIMVQ
jgi:hypothetical protein